MDRAIYTVMAGARQTMDAQTVHANNLANVSTVGFRKDFAAAQSRYVHADGTQDSRVTTSMLANETDFSAGALQETGRDLDVAIEGNGFIAVIAKDGSEAYTRAGDLHLNTLGQLTTREGLLVLGNGGPIAIPPAEKIEIGDDGGISIRSLGQGPETLSTVDRIRLVSPEGKDIKKREDGLFEARDGAPLPVDPTLGVVSGNLETSNVNAVEAMTEVLSLSRQFELQLKILTTVDTTTEAATRLLSTS
ncbi:MAG: flagellar basal-body rod protein FlgF [Pseudomonadales bacterium]